MLIIIAIAGCNNTNAEEAEILQALRLENENLSQMLEEQKQEIQRIEEIIYTMQAQSGETNQTEQEGQAEQELHVLGFTKSEIEADLIENAQIILDAVGGDEIVFENIVIVNWYVFASVWVTGNMVSQNFHALLSFSPGFYDNFQPDGTLRWNFLAHDLLYFGMVGSEITEYPLQNHQFPGRDTVPIMVYTYRDVDDYDYEEREISAENWQEEIKDLFLPMGLHLQGIWFEGNRIMVDLMPTQLAQFDWGSTGSFLRAGTLIRPLLSLPGAYEVEVLFDGIGNITTSHASFDGIYVRAEDDGSGWFPGYLFIWNEEQGEE